MNESELRYQQLLEHLPQTVFETDLHGTLTYVNRSAYKIFGYSEVEFRKGFNVIAAIAPRDRPLVMENIRHIVNREPIKSHEYTAIDKSGREFPIVIYSRLIEENGSAVGIRGIIADVSDIKLAEEAHILNESKFHAIYDQAVHLAGILDIDGTMTDANATARRFIGQDESAFIGRPFWQTAWWTHSPQIQEKLRLSIERAARGEFIQFETTHIDASGELRHIDFTIKPVFDSQGKVFCLIPEGRDITARKRAEMEREQLHNQLLMAQKLESIGRLAGGMAHDFNNMIGAIIGYAELEIKRRMDSPDPDYISQILRAARRSAELTRQLLIFARKQPFKPLTLSLNRSIEDHLDMLRRLIGEEIDLTWHPDDSCWPVRLDPAQLDQVLTNLCLNARDAISGVGWIRIETANLSVDAPTTISTGSIPAGDYVVLSVRDNGKGMDDMVRDHLFEPFFTTKDSGKGTGLGLATVYGIVSQNRGFIDISTRPGEGSAFRIFFPSDHGVDLCPDQGRLSEETLPGHGETILLVEDEPAILEMAQLMLEFLQYKSLTANSPGEALDLMEQHQGQIDLLITDVIMPGMNGRELAERINTQRPGIACLFMSGYPAEHIARRGRIESGVEFIQKPFSLPELSRKIHHLLIKKQPTTHKGDNHDTET